MSREPGNSVGQSGDVANGHHETGLTLVDDVGASGVGCRQHGQARGHGFQDDDAEPFAQRRKHDGIDLSVVLRHLLPWDFTEDLHVWSRISGQDRRQLG